jgi:oxygen-independent coproporphyrinogen-3 oxidase
MTGGLYIHIPFCRQACHYCDFHFAISLNHKAEMLQAMEKEMERNAGFFEGSLLRTLYFGGGTPSVLKSNEIEKLLATARKNFGIEPNVEITLEANPDDLTKDYCKAVHDLGINRLSIGVQSFDDNDLKWMNRIHNAEQALSAIENSKLVGFDNINIDLIFGVPGSHDERWLNNIKTALNLDVQHISTYSLTVEEGTPLKKLIQKGKMQNPEDALSERQYVLMMDKLETAGWEHYEISNFCKPGLYSRHNTSYWQGIPYLGIGPSAHSFKDGKRRWNAKNNSWYIRAITEGTACFEEETLTPANKANEMLMTGLRTRWGADLDKILSATGIDIQKAGLPKIEELLAERLIYKEGPILRVTSKGKLFADYTASQLFVV